MQDTAEAKTSSAPLRKIKTALTYPGAYFRYRSNNLRSFYHTVSRLAHVRTRAARCNNIASGQLAIDDAKGYAIFQANQIPDDLGIKAVQEIREKIKAIDVDAIRRAAKKPYLLKLLEGKDIPRDSYMYKLATHPDILNCVSRYLKCFPILTYMAVWYSPNLPGEIKGSQKFHLDHEDYRQVKAFLFIEDIGPENGPFTLLPADDSLAVQNAVNYKMTPDEKQIEDEQVYKVTGNDNAVRFTGPAGTLGLVDTSRCFHYGSREGKSPRLLLTFQYMTPFAFVMPWNWRKKPLLPHFHTGSMSTAERKLLGIDL